MQVVLCDICDTPIRGKAVEIHVILGDAVYSETRGTRIVSRDGTTMSFLCESCGQWTQSAMEYLRQGYVDAQLAEQQAGEPALPRTEPHTGQPLGQPLGQPASRSGAA